MFSADPQLCADAEGVFQQIASQATVRPPRQLLTAPFVLQDRLLTLLGRVADAARCGGPARVVLKCNTLTDLPLIDALVAAAQAGAEIDLIVRGACMLPPGVAGWTERVRVRSIVGRFLEHSRIIYLRWGEADDEEALYLSSADWMNRNMTRRVEVAWPVRDPSLRQRVIDEALMPYLHDARDAWQLCADGHYERVQPEGPGAQAALMARYGT
jgi:polyphosphate kinase